MQEFQEISGNCRLSAKQEKAVSLLLGNHTIAEVAKQVGVTERTLYNWLRHSDFQERLELEKKKLREQAFDKLRTTLNKAVECLENLLESKAESIKLRACQTILDYNIKLAEIKELEERLEKLEDAVK